MTNYKIMKTLLVILLTILSFFAYSQTKTTHTKYLFGTDVVQHGTTMGRPIWRSNAKGDRAWGQIGCNAKDWSAEKDSIGYVTYVFFQDYINTTDTFILWYSKNTTTCDVTVLFGKTDQKKIKLTPTGDWNIFKPIKFYFTLKDQERDYNFIAFKFRPQKYGNFEISHIELIQKIPKTK